MLTGLSIRDVVLIETLDLEFGPGLGVLTGETGAGKSILLDALGLALGSARRQRPGAQRPGTGRRSASPSTWPPAIRRWRCSRRTASPATRGEPLVIRRMVKADGGSRAFVNDQPVSAGLLRELGALLVEIHGQHDDRGLLNPRGHRALLDAFGRIDAAPAAAAWQRLRDAEAALAEARARSTRRPSATANGWPMPSRSWTGSRPSRARRKRWRACARPCRPAPGSATSSARSTALLQGSEGGLAQLRQAARRLDRIAGEHRLAGRGAGGARPGGDRGGRGRGRARPRAARRSPSIRRGSRKPRRGCSRFARLARKHRVEPDALPALKDELAARLAAIEAGAEQDRGARGRTRRRARRPMTKRRRR